MCLLVDREVSDLEVERVHRLEAGSNTTTPTYEMAESEVRERSLCIKVVDSVWDPKWDENHSQYAGWAFVKAEHLY